jgi:hypothetical protein
MKLTVYRNGREGETARVGSISLVDGKLKVDSGGNPNSERFLNYIIREKVPAYPLKSRKLYSGASDYIMSNEPEAFLMALQFQYRGRVTAVLER